VTSPLPLTLTAESSSPRSFRLKLDHALLYGVIGFLLFGPLAFGAVESWSMSIMQVGSSLLFALWAARQVTTGEIGIVGNPLFLPILFFAGLILWQLATGRTAYRADTFSTALLYFAYGLLCFLVVQCLRRTSQLKVLAWVFSGYGFAIALFALMQGIAPNGKLYWLRSLPSGGWIYGPFVNHNHYAGLMEMLTPIPLVISLADNVRDSRRALAALAAAVMASTIFLSGSRGGMAAFAIQMALLAGFLVTRRKNRKVALVLGGFLIVAVALMAWVGGGELVERLVSMHDGTRTELSSGSRLTIDRDALKIFAQKPVLGWGLGTFPDIYPQFSNLSTNFQVGPAHNDYLQLLVETGALGFATMLWFLLILFGSALKKLKHFPADANTTVTLAAALGVTGILVHSVVDFNLQSPANAALFYVLCTVAAMEPRFGRHSHRHSTSTSRGYAVQPRAYDLRPQLSTKELEVK
jgi:O-antigen ligase